MDTKWKELKNPEEHKDTYNFDISKEDIYQMITYIHVYNSKAKKCNKAYLVYPINNNDKTPLIENIVFSGENELEVRACFVDLSSEDNTKESLKKILESIK